MRCEVLKDGGAQVVVFVEGGSEPRALEVIGWTIGWAVFLGLLFLLMHYEPALRC